MNPSKSLAIAALAGLLAGTTVACSGDSSAPEVKAPEAPAAPAEVAVAPEAEQPAKMAEHACKGMNECKAQGGCMVEGANSCAGANDCKAKGGCCTMEDKTACPGDGMEGMMGGDKEGAKTEAAHDDHAAKKAPAADTTIKGGRGATEEKAAPSTVKGGRGAPAGASKEPSTVKGGR